MVTHEKIFVAVRTKNRFQIDRFFCKTNKILLDTNRALVNNKIFLKEGVSRRSALTNRAENRTRSLLNIFTSRILFEFFFLYYVSQC